MGAAVPSFEGRAVDDPDTQREMITRRDGSIGVRVLANRVASYRALVVVALSLGALIAFASS